MINEPAAVWQLLLFIRHNRDITRHVKASEEPADLWAEFHIDLRHKLQSVVGDKISGIYFLLSLARIRDKKVTPVTALLFLKYL